MSRFERHVFVCIHERGKGDARGCCAARGGEDVHRWFREELSARGWRRRMRANSSGCLDACAFGPAVVVYPEGTWYAPQSQEDVRRICEDHLGGGRIVTELEISALRR